MSPRVQRTVIDPEVVGVWQDTHPLNAPQGLFAGVRPLMDSDAALPGEAFGVDRALEALFADVRPFVAGDISLSGEPPGAERTPGQFSWYARTKKMSSLVRQATQRSQFVEPKH